MRTQHLRILLLLAGAMLCSLSLSAQTDITKPPRPQKQQQTTTTTPSSLLEKTLSSSSSTSSSSSQQTTTTPKLMRSGTTVSNATGNINGHGYVDLGLSVKWATCNVGASRPEDYGNYYAWGETRTKSEYTSDNSVTYGKQMGSIAGSATYDAARANWGSTWRLPTDDEIGELVDKCKHELTTLNGVNGYKVVGPNGNSIFLPAAGYRYGSSLNRAGDGGYYWSATPYEDGTNIAYDLFFYGDGFYRGWVNRSHGRSVRPVSE